jgi:hypothetical protein
MKCPGCGNEVDHLVEVEPGYHICEDCADKHFESTWKMLEQAGLIENYDKDMWRITEKGKNASPSMFAGLGEEEAKKMITGTMKRAHIPPHIQFAFEKTGRLVTAENMHLLSPEELEEWRHAVEEYYQLHRGTPTSVLRVSDRRQL